MKKKSSFLYQALIKVFDENQITYIPAKLYQTIRNLRAEADPIDQILEWCHGEEIRTNRIALSSDLLTHPIGNLLACFGKNKIPCPLIECDNQYWLYDLNQEPVPLTPELFAQLDSTAYFFYQSSDVSTLTDLLKKSLPAKEIRQIIGVCLIISLTGFAIPFANALAFNFVVPFHELSYFMQMIVLLLSSFVAYVGFDLIRRILLFRLILSFNINSSRIIWDKLLKLPLSFLLRHTTAELMMGAESHSEVGNSIDINMLANWLTNLFGLMSIVLIFYFSPLLGLLTLILCIPVFIGFIAAIRLALIRIHKTITIKRTVYQFTFELFNAMEKLQLNAAKQLGLEKWHTLFTQMKNLQVLAFNSLNAIKVMSRGFFVLSLLFFYGFAVLYFGQLSLGTFVAVISAYTLFIQSMFHLVNDSREILTYWAEVKQSNLILEAPMHSNTGSINPSSYKGKITVHNVSMSYEKGETQILRNVSITANPGEFIAIVGLSGSGKSTLFKCIMGQQEIDEGDIMFDDHSLSLLNIPSLHQKIGIVMQNSKLVAGSILENIQSGSDLAYNEIIEICCMLGINDWIEALPMKLHTILDESGSTFSGGEQQLILLARAVARRPTFLLLDEATSALDNVTQAQISNALNKLKMTRIMIAHRLSTIVNADRIYVLDRGEIIQTGTYDELINQPGLFADLMNPQLSEEM